jgi:hypothetical protein
VATLPNKYIMLITIMWAFFFMGESIISIATMCLIGYAINRNILTHLNVNNERLKQIEEKAMAVFSHFKSTN